MIRIATFNLKDFFEPRTDAERAVAPAKLANVANLLRRADADVVALQEVGSEALLRTLVDEVASLRYSTLHVGPVDRRGIGCAIIARLPVSRKDVVTAESLAFPRFQETDAAPFAALPLRRPVVHLCVDAGALGVIDVLTVHLKSRLATPMRGPDGEPVVDASASGIGEAHLRAWVLRAAEALHLRAVIDRLFDDHPEHSLVVLGDFNDAIEALPTRIVRGAFAQVDPARRLASCTDSIAVERRFSILHAGAPDLIDHIFVSPGLAARLTGAAILNEELRDHGPHEPDAPLAPDSDHAPVVATFA